MADCPYCLKRLEDIPPSSIGCHVRWCDSNPNRKRKKIKFCEECGRQHIRRSKYCSLDCSSIQIYKPETRLKISNSRKKYLLNNPDKHPWKKKDKFKSEPCERLKRHLTSKNIKFIEEWQPLEDRFFSIDIAFPDIKLGIEVNGNQHYDKDGSLKPYYQERHDLIEASGWKLIELHYSTCYNTDAIDSILKIKEQPDYTEYFKQKEKQKVKLQTLPRGQKIKIKSDKKWEPFKQLVVDSEIDFSSFGWVKQVAKLLGIKHQKVNAWMKRYLPEFYELRCFKRKAGVSHGPSKPALIE